jgi:hypothetical protein
MKRLVTAGAIALTIGMGMLSFISMFTGASTDQPVDGGAVSYTAPVPNQVVGPGQEAGCQALVTATAAVRAPGIDLNVCRAWFKVENGAGPGQPANNYIFISCTHAPCMTLAGRDWQVYASPAEGVAAIVSLLQAKDYAGVLASFGLPPEVQIQAIGESPWCECHYGDPPGTDLLKVYRGVVQAQGAKP